MAIAARASPAARAARLRSTRARASASMRSMRARWRRAIAREEVRRVAARLRRRREAVRRVVEVELRIAGERVALGRQRRVDRVQQEVPLPGMRGEVDHRVGAGQVEAVQVERLAGGRVGEAAARRCEGLAQIEGVERAAAGVPHQDDALVALARGAQALGDVEQQALVDQRGVVVEPAAVLAQHGEAGVEQRRHGVVAREVRARVHQAHHAALAAARVEPAVRERVVGRHELERLARRARRQRPVPLDVQVGFW